MSNTIDVITPSIRPQGLVILAKSLANQIKKPDRWIICGPELKREEVKRNIGKIFKYTYIGNPPLKKGMFWDLNLSYNQLFRESTAQIIVTWQDWIYAEPDALEKFVDNVLKTNAVVSGVGDQYEGMNKWGRPEVKIWSDPRKTDKYGSFYEVNPNDAEWNFCAFPKPLIYAVGGMDEQLDFLGYGGDQLQVGERMDAIGVKFYLDQSNESYTIRHDRSDFGGQEAWDANHVLFNGKYDARKKELIETGQWPKLKYLD